MTIRLRDDLKENLTYLALWLLLFLTPIVSMCIRVSSNEYTSFDWASIFRVWSIYTIYLVIFLIHNFVLAPLLIYKHKKAMYLAATIALLAVFVACQFNQRPHFDGKHDIFAPLPPPEGKPAFDGHHPDRRPGMPPFSLGPADIVNTVMVVLFLGMNLGVKLYFKSARDAKQMQALERQNLEHQLEYLKSQVNPHFFMNTLNNIHALVDIDSEKAKATILELSRLMRYVLYEGAKSSVPLGREVAFLHHYVTLMELRYTDKVQIHIDIPDAIPDYSVPPLLFITFLENAFKHGISYQQPSYIHMQMRFADQRVSFACANSKHAETTDEQGGVGLANVKKRLQLIYGDNYSLDIQDDGKEYAVKLDIQALTE